MRVKGTAYVARLNLLEKKLGKEALDAFLAEYWAEHPEFPRHVITTTQIPADLFLHLMDTIVTRLYDGDVESLWEIGERSAEWSLTQGPYKPLLELQDIERFAAMAPVMWANFFDQGNARSEVGSDRIDLWIEGVPDNLHHLYFEYSVVGYFRRGLELLGAAVDMERAAGFSAGDPFVHYILRLSRK